MKEPRFFSIYLEITQKVPIFVPAEINEWYGKSDGHSLDLQRLRSLVEETGYGVRTTVTKPRLSATMKYGLSDTVIKELQDVFRRHANIRKVLIFGSRSKGNFREGSDIDLALIGNGIDYRQLLEILCEIDNLELLYSVDLLDYQKKKGTPIGDHIERFGQVFYEAA